MSVCLLPFGVFCIIHDASSVAQTHNARTRWQIGCGNFDHFLNFLTWIETTCFIIQFHGAVGC